MARIKQVLTERQIVFKKAVYQWKMDKMAKEKSIPATRIKTQRELIK